MNSFSRLKSLFLFLTLSLGTIPLWAGPADWSFLPGGTVFKPFIGDPQEPLTGIISYLNEVNYVGQVGGTLEMVRYSPSDGAQFGWGLFGSGFILLGQDGATFPMQAANWFVGTYFSAAIDDLSFKVGALHESAHLGDSLENIQIPFFYSRENANCALSWQPSDDCRFYGGMGDWFDINPPGNPFFAFMGTELYTPYWSIDHSLMRGYATAHFEYKAEVPTLNGISQLGLDWVEEYQVGLQWKSAANNSRDIRIAFLYYNGPNAFGQFYYLPDNHIALATFFDF